MFYFRIDRALKVCRVSVEEKYHRDPVPTIPELPSTVRKYFFNILTVACLVVCYWGIYASYFLVFT